MAVFGAAELGVEESAVLGCSFELGEGETESCCYKGLARESFGAGCFAGEYSRDFFCLGCLYTSDDLLFCSNT